MSKKEIVEYLRQNMPNFQGTEEERQVKTALYIYVELGKIKSFDPKYYFGNSETRKKLYNLAQKKDSNQIASKKKIICVSLTHLYCNILTELGIYAMSSEAEEVEGHIYPIVITKNKKAFIADLQLDLENIKTKSRLEHFEYKGEFLKNKRDSVNQEELTKILIEIGYISDEKEYKNETIKRLAEQVKDKNPHDALRTILEDEELYQRNEEMEIVEVNKFYKGILKKIIPQFLERKVFVFNCYREKEENERDYTLCIFSEESTIKPYLFSKKERRFLRVEIPKMKELEAEGLKLGTKPKENGANKLKKYISRENIEPQTL